MVIKDLGEAELQLSVAYYDYDYAKRYKTKRQQIRSALRVYKWDQTVNFLRSGGEYKEELE